MKKYIVAALLLVITLVFLSGCEAVKNSGSDVQYHMLLSGHASGYTVLKQWTGRGNLTTENFTIKSDTWALYTSNTPDSTDWENNRGYLKVTLYSSSKSQVIIDTYRPNESTVELAGSGGFGAGTYHLEIESSNARFIVRAEIKQGADLVLQASPYPMAGEKYIDILKNGLPLGCRWGIRGTLTSTAGDTKTVGLALQLYEEVGGIPRQIQQTQTVAVSNSSDPHTSSFDFQMPAKTEPGTYTFQIIYNLPNEPIGTVDAVLQIATTRAVYISMDNIEEGRVGEQFYVTARVKDYLGDEPVAGAAVKFAYSADEQSPWTNWNTNIVTDQSGQAKIDLVKTQELLFPGIGDWEIKALFPGGKLNGIDYPAVDSSSHHVSYEKGTAIINLSVNAPPSTSFTPFKLSCAITSEEGQPISGQLTGELDGAKGGGISLPMGAFNQDNTTPITFTLSLESGSYTFRASFIGNKYYESAVSNDLPVKFGQ